jgi:hypothetical protein
MRTRISGAKWRSSVAVALSVLALLAVAAYLAQTSHGSGSDGVPTPNANRPREISSGKVEISSGEGSLFSWFVLAQRDRRRLIDCFYIEVVGPKRGEQNSGQVQSENQCGVGKKGRIEVVPIRGTRHWPEFEIGLGVYPGRIDRVRIVRPDGSAESFAAEQLPSSFKLYGVDDLHYAVFAIKGCAYEVQGIRDGHIVSRVREQECLLLAEDG